LGSACPYVGLDVHNETLEPICEEIRF